MTFKVTILGSGSALPAIGKHHSAHALNVHEQFYLIDCGEGTQMRLLEAGISPMKLNALFLSHLHGDHSYGIFPLLSTLGMMGRKTPLKIFAPKPFDEIIECHKKFYDLRLDYEIQFVEVHTRIHEKIFENNVMEVWSIPLRHRVPAAGFLFREKEPKLNVRKEAIEKYALSVAQIVAAKRGDNISLDDGAVLGSEEVTYRPYKPRSYAYCSDTLYSGKVVGIVHGVDLLYHEATFLQSDKDVAVQTGHTTALQAGQAAERAGAGRLLIGHFSGRYKDPQPLIDEARSVFPATEFAAERRTFEIKPERIED